jgi:hypothetical protein
MKARIAVLTGLLGFFVFSGQARANEGTVLMTAEPGKVGSCFAASVYVDASYRVLISCRDLPVALTAEVNRYVVWRDNAGKVSRLGYLSNGKLLGSSVEKFDRLFVTAEVGSSVNKPSTEIMVSGSLQSLVFAGTQPGTRVTVAPTQEATKLTSPTPTPERGSGVTSGVVGVIKGIGRAVIYGFVLLLVVVGVLGFLARRKTL